MEFQGEPRENQIAKITPVNFELNQELLKYFRGEKDGFVEVGNKKWFLPMKYTGLALFYRNFKIRSNDVWITGMPRSGTTVTQELAWLLCHNLDYEAAKEDLDERVRYFELDLVFNDKTIKERQNKYPEDSELPRLGECIQNNLEFLDSDEKRRLIKTHLPFELLPPDIFEKGCKIIYVCRNPKDVAVSYYHYEKGSWHLNFDGNFENYWNFFKSGKCTFCPYFEHIKQAYEKRNFKNLHFVFYEDFRKDPRAYIENMATFLGRDLGTDEIQKLENYLIFDNFKKNPAVSKPIRDVNDNTSDFIREGKVGGWQKHFTEKMTKEADKWIEENTSEIGIQWPKSK